MTLDFPFSTTITNLINANETHIDNVATLTGVAKDSTNFGTFTGSTITDNQTLKGYPVALGRLLLLRATSTTLSLKSILMSMTLSLLTGISENTTGLGTFTGSTISDDSTIKAALRDLETAAESAPAGSAVADQSRLLPTRLMLLSMWPSLLITTHLQLLKLSVLMLVLLITLPAICWLLERFL